MPFDGTYVHGLFDMNLPPAEIAEWIRPSRQSRIGLQRIFLHTSRTLLMYEISRIVGVTSEVSGTF